ncbi:MAG: hypothetical protein KGZ97_03095 [Bacteroidetes bacterium]|nr:hypothetical protein [Bacteroidota bacterium]
MKTRLLFLIGIVSFLIGLTACELEPFCKECYIVTYNAQGIEEGRVSVGEYCDAALYAIEGTEDVDPSGIKTVYECE